MSDPSLNDGFESLECMMAKPKIYRLTVLKSCLILYDMSDPIHVEKHPTPTPC